MRLETIDEDRLLRSAEAVVAADKAKLAEAQLNWEVAKMSVGTSEQKDKADLQSMKAKLSDATNKAQRTRELFDKKLASAEELETALTTQAAAEADMQNAEVAVAELEQTKKGVDTKFQQIAEAKAQLDQDQAKYETAKQNVEYCNVFAPNADVGRETDPPLWRISKLTPGIAVGYLVQSGSSGPSGGTTVMTLADMSHIFVLATVDESDIGRLLTRFDAGLDLPVKLTADAYKNVEFTGKVVRIATIGVNTSNVVTFEVKIEVTSPNRTLLRPIMTANCEIISAEQTNVLTVPVQAVSRHRVDTTEPGATQEASATTIASATPATQPANPAGKKRARKKRDPVPDSLDKPTPGTVTVVKADGSTESREVMVGLSDDTSYEILSGLQEGETVVLNKNGADSKWRGGGGGRGGPGAMMRGMGS